MRVAMVLPGLGRVQRGAEAAFLELAHALGETPGVSVELFGSGRAGVGDVPIHVVGCRPRERFERWPRVPMFRSDCHYEEFSFARKLAASRLYRPQNFDIVVSCTYPHVHWYLRRAARKGGPKLVHVTQNGDWPCRSNAREFRFFRCDGLVCTNPEYFEANRRTHRAVLIPNGVDPDVFHPGEETSGFDGLPLGPAILMVSALIPSKRVEVGVRAAAMVPGASLVVAGDGPLRSEIAALANALMPGRHLLLGSVDRSEMPRLFRRASAFLHASRDEPFGIVYLEAAASGLPVVAHDAAVPRWVLGDQALYADMADPSAVADRLRIALDPEFGPALGRLARERIVEGWTWRDQADRYLSFFRDLTGVLPLAQPVMELAAR